MDLEYVDARAAGGASRAVVLARRSADPTLTGMICWIALLAAAPLAASAQAAPTAAAFAAAAEHRYEPDAPRQAEEQAEDQGEAEPRRERVASVCDEAYAHTEGDELIDQVQRGVYYGVCGVAHWFDGLFGTTRYDADSGDSFGRIGVFPGWDDRDGLSTRVRLRARLVLPAMEERLALVVGRGDQQDFTEEQASSTGTPVPASFRRIDDDQWLVGLAYGRRDAFENGFDYGTGIRIRAPLDPYVKGAYTHHFVLDQQTLLRLRQTAFWRNSRGLGTKSEVMFDRVLGERYLLRWNNAGTVAGDTEGVEWGSVVSLFHNFSDRRGMIYSVLSEGETSADIKLQNYGVETRYRQNVGRRWLFMELSASATWPRETLDERRRFNPGVGIGFDMYFGPVPERQMR